MISMTNFTSAQIIILKTSLHGMQLILFHLKNDLWLELAERSPREQKKIDVRFHNSIYVSVLYIADVCIRY